jgi:hypothetical protein
MRGVQAGWNGSGFLTEQCSGSGAYSLNRYIVATIAPMIAIVAAASLNMIQPQHEFNGDTSSILHCIQPGD